MSNALRKKKKPTFFTKKETRIIGRNDFESRKKFIPFRDKCAELTKLLWADNEIFRQNSIAHTAPHTTKKGPQKRGV